MKKKYYAVAKGKTSGIYFTWEDCKVQVEHFPGAVYKSFQTLEEAEAFIELEDGKLTEHISSDDGKQMVLDDLMMGVDTVQIGSIIKGFSKEGKEKESKGIRPISTGGHLVAYVDGSYEHSKRAYAYGCVLVLENEIVKLNGKGNNEEFITMRNVAGEIWGSECAISWAVEHGYEEITIYYDYEGIEKWATGEWKATKRGTIAYKEFIEEKKKEICIHFVKVEAHTGVEYNEMADQLAKAALGI
ncbi:MAG: ribonuclease H family protein [Lachnospiraceae bacterium]|nr:ribonuclease H family protein [Lachnospiraceae bacterium]